MGSRNTNRCALIPTNQDESNIYISLYIYIYILYIYIYIYVFIFIFSTLLFLFHFTILLNISNQFRYQFLRLKCLHVSNIICWKLNFCIIRTSRNFIYYGLLHFVYCYTYSMNNPIFPDQVVLKNLLFFKEISL